MNPPKHFFAENNRHPTPDNSLPGEYEFPFAEELDNFRHLHGVRQREGVREYLHDQTDVLFVVGHLPLCGCPDDLLFGRNTRGVFAVMHEHGIIPSLDPDPIENEIEVFAMREIRTKERPFSIVSVFSPPENIQGRQVTFGDWERIWSLLDPLNVQKIAIMGKSLIEKHNWRLEKQLRQPTAYGHIGHRQSKFRQIPVFGLPLTNLRQDGQFFQKIAQT